MLSNAVSDRIFLSPPHLSGDELRYIEEAIRTNWVAPVGANLDAFEAELCAYTGAAHAVAVHSGTAAIHLALEVLGVGPGDEVLCSDLTFVAAANPIRYLGATPIFIDSEPETWNMDPELLAEALRRRARKGRLPKAAVIVHLYGQSAALEPLVTACRAYGVAIVEDAAESLGATYQDRFVGTWGDVGIYSFNGNKIITTSGGGAVVSPDARLIDRARYLASQAREPGLAYEHNAIGYNYRLSNILAGLGRAQLSRIEDYIARRRAIFETYAQALGDLPGVGFMPEAATGRSTRWLSCMTLDPEAAPIDSQTLIEAVHAEGIEVRPVWRPMHQQPIYADAEIIGGAVSARLAAQGICLPSSSGHTSADLDRVITSVRKAFSAAL